MKKQDKDHITASNQTVAQSPDHSAHKQIKKTSRRKALITALAGGAVVTTGSAPTKWITPVVEGVVLPAHAMTSPSSEDEPDVSEDEPDVACGQSVQAGGDEPETHIVELGQSIGTFRFDYRHDGIKDQVIVRYEGNVLFDSGCVGTTYPNYDSTFINYSGSSTQIEVEVIPNCEGGTSTGTIWVWIAYCPGDPGP